MSLDVEATDSEVNLTYGQDNLNLFTHFMDPSPATKFVVEKHPITVLSDYSSKLDPFFNSGSLGLGPSSTLLKQLVDVGRIDRNVVGLYLGTAYPRAGGSQNGSIVLGGYDAGRINGEAHEYPQVDAMTTNASPFRVHVKQMSLVTEDGSSIGLVTNEGFDGYISTDQYAVELPDSTLSQLSTALGGTPTNDAENVLQLSKKFNGNLMITLDDGYEITYPSEWISNASNKTPFSASSSNANITADGVGPLIFGTAFLHHLYMTIDYDASTFSLADAKMFKSYVQPQSLCLNTLPTALKSPKINRFTQSGMIGAILGGIIGGLGIAFLIFFCVRKHLQHKHSKEAISKMEGGGVGPTKSSLRTRTKRGLVRFSRAKDTKHTHAKTKRVSFTDSDSSSLKNVTVTVVNKGTEDSRGIELDNIKHKHTSQIAEVSLASPVSPISPDGLGKTGTSYSITQLPDTSIEAPLPTPNRFTNSYALSPLATPFALDTPRTGNPLLGNYRGFLNYADDDDSDLKLKPEHPSNHRRTPSDQLRQQLGLIIDTNVGVRAKKDSVTSIGTSRSMGPRSKPAPLPIKVASSARSRARPLVKTEADYVKRNPVRAMFGKGNNGQHEGVGESKPSALRRVFPTLGSG